MYGTITECPTYEIAAYIDGELHPEREREIDLHLAACSRCLRELNQQKLFLCGLNSTLKREGDLKLPENFTKIIVTNAESSVAGLRGARERYNALLICLALLLFGVIALGTEAERLWQAVAAMFEQVGAVGGLFGRIVYSVFLGVTIILRSLASQLRNEPALGIVFWAGFVGLLMFVSRKFLLTRRA